MSDARFEDAEITDKPLRLKAESADDLTVISSLLQDAVGKAGAVSWLPKKRRLMAFVNRFRWENGAGRTAGPLERVQCAVTVESVLRVRGRGIDPADRDRVYELLAILFEPAGGCAGTLKFTLAGGAEIAVEVECLDIAMADLTRPWAARARRAPRHDA